MQNNVDLLSKQVLRSFSPQQNYQVYPLLWGIHFLLDHTKWPPLADCIQYGSPLAESNLMKYATSAVQFSPQQNYRVYPLLCRIHFLLGHAKWLPLPDWSHMDRDFNVISSMFSALETKFLLQ